MVKSTGLSCNKSPSLYCTIGELGRGWMNDSGTGSMLPRIPRSGELPGVCTLAMDLTKNLSFRTS